MQVGDLLRVTLPDGQAGSALVAAVDEARVGLWLGAVIWTCAPGADELAEGPWVVALTVPRARLVDVVCVGSTQPEPMALGTAVDAPLWVLFQGMLGLV